MWSHLLLHGPSNRGSTKEYNESRTKSAQTIRAGRADKLITSRPRSRIPRSRLCPPPREARRTCARARRAARARCSRAGPQQRPPPLPGPHPRPSTHQQTPGHSRPPPCRPQGPAQARRARRLAPHRRTAWRWRRRRGDATGAALSCRWMSRTRSRPPRAQAHGRHPRAPRRCRHRRRAHAATPSRERLQLPLPPPAARACAKRRAPASQRAELPQGTRTAATPPPTGACAAPRTRVSLE
mmetsp:Transcript_14502/g.60505  ORF Transcript_14502/g.60505 Transcript_14502/m.60505 type:complete len:240 (-) Transcript_14502:283-1002(-)